MPSLIQSLNSYIRWTKHSRAKLRQYNLSESRVKRVVRHPFRIEKGIAPNTIACLQKAGSKKHPYELWVMYQIKKVENKVSLLTIISAWKYPGTTNPGDPIPIPPEILGEIIEDLNYQDNK